MDAKVRFQQLIFLHIPVVDLAENISEKPYVRFVGQFSALVVNKIYLADIQQNRDGNN
jgi:hypothetical protein